MNQGFAETYIVKRGDSLSNILYSLQAKPIYGLHGSLRETLSINPQIKKRKNYKLYLGEKINLVHVNSVFPKTNISNERIPTENFKQGFYWKISPTLSWKSLSSKDENVFMKSNIQALSQTCYGAGITYGMHLEENLDFYSRFSFESVSFRSDATISLSNKKFLSTSFAFGGLFSQKVSVELGMDDQYFLTSSALNTVEIKKTIIPKGSVSYFQNLYQNRKADIAAIYSGRIFLPRSSSDFQTKLGVGAGAEFQFKLMNQSFGIGYDYNILKSQSNTTNSQNIYWKYLWETL